MATRKAQDPEPSSTVLVAYDGSPSATRALAMAAEVTRPGSRILVLNVVPVQSVSSRLETVSDVQRARQRHLLAEARVALSGRHVEAEPVRGAGEPWEQILAAAEAGHAGLIVLGRGRHPRWPSWRSTSLRVVRRASCAVLVVP